MTCPPDTVNAKPFRAKAAGVAVVSGGAGAVVSGGVGAVVSGGVTGGVGDVESGGVGAVVSEAKKVNCASNPLPCGVVTETRPVEPEPTTASTVESVITTYEAALVPPKLTAVAPVR